jgi:glyoxylase-like metal-dependent hydrolase (beta-lactamase superfamily II)
MSVDVVAIRYGSLRTTRAKQFLDYPRYGEADAACTMDYYLWVVRTPSAVVLVDTGFDAAVGARRGRTVHIDPVAAVAALGVDPGDVKYLIVTHFHYDHIGNVHRFPNARVCFQNAELDYWTGRATRDAAAAALVEPDEIEHLRSVPSDRLDGDADVVPGVSVVRVGGHTPGQQIVIVDGDDRRIVLASDAAHFYEEIELDRPHMIADDPAAMLATYERLRVWEADGSVVVAGHDPRVMSRFPAVPGVDPRIAVRIAA